MQKKVEIATAKKMDSLKAQVLKEVKPSASEHKILVSHINALISRLKEKVPRNVEIIVAGSLARGTNLRGDSDVDIFLLFKKSVSKEEMEKKALQVGKDLVKGKRNESYEIKYAEHPYVRLLLEDIGVRADLVPAYKIYDAQEMGTAVDRTQLHNTFINSKLNPRQKDDVRVLKAFLKAHGIYGAEAKVEGFSGYLCELLICNYKSFEKLIESIAVARLPLVIDLNGAPDAASAPKRFGKTFVVVDPTDHDRNVAANVSDESLARFVLAARALAANPSDPTFYQKGHSEQRAATSLLKVSRSLGLETYCIYLKADDISDEIIWQQAKRLKGSLLEKMSKNGFEAVISLQAVDEQAALIGLMVNGTKIGYRVAKGPSALIKNASEQFIKAHKNSVLTSLEGDRIYSIEKSAFNTVQECINFMLLKGGIPLPSHISKKGIKVYKDAAIPERHAKILYRAYVQKTSF